ncbi:serine/threonine-protein kinase [Kitasatospora aureofaciens]|uniref:serine/threonine-protein kinase n=1 Tax=Kitasatospora aureofaciens TaxID=1894 RepID=UPI001C4802DC|nr:serine/threonine-protein kinase [Kitasatospora aureofaciens]MBV6695759.1 serine/threonine protein kinase [Kitasatospora aureofaciens]
MTDSGGRTAGTALPGMLIDGRYRLTARLGRGGMGTVWRATDERIHRQVALKEPLLPDGLDETERTERCRRMEREAQAMAGIRHPHVVRVHDIATVDGLPWLVMELVEGESLDVTLATGTLDVTETAAVARQLAAALAAVHEAGVVHRDVKPGNVLRTRSGDVLLTDFGIAQLDDGLDLTRTGLVIGSVPYLSPERAAGLRPGPAADIWALGLVLFELLEGVNPYRRQSVPATMAAILRDPVPTPHRAGRLTSPILRLLEPDPQRRPTAAEAVRLFTEPATAATAAPTAVLPTPASRTTVLPTPTAVEPVAPPAGAPTESPATVRLTSGGRPSLLARLPRTRRGRIATAVAVLAVAAGGVTAWLINGRPADTPPPAAVPRGYTAQRVDALGLGVAVPASYAASIGADEASWSSPDGLTQIQIRDEGAASKTAREYADDRLKDLHKAASTCHNDSPLDIYAVGVMHDTQSVLHSGGVNAAALEYNFTRISEWRYDCLVGEPQHDLEMEQYLVHDKHVLHVTVQFIWNRRNNTDNTSDNRQLYQNVSGSLAFS